MKKTRMKNVIIVEGKDDKKFMEAYAGHFRKMFPGPDEHLEIDKIEKAGGEDGIFVALKALKIYINKGETKNIGILIDADEVGIKGKSKKPTPEGQALD